MGENYALELRDISKSFGSVQANDHVDLTLRKSEILAILGENGSGKTTLMNMIYGIYYPDEGHIFVNGKEVTIRSPKDSYELGIGMVHQHFKLVDVLTAAENIVLGLPGKGKLDMKRITEDIQKLAPYMEAILKTGSICALGGEERMKKEKELFGELKPLIGGEEC